MLVVEAKLTATTTTTSCCRKMMIESEKFLSMLDDLLTNKSKSYMTS